MDNPKFTRLSTRYEKERRIVEGEHANLGDTPKKLDDMFKKAAIDAKKREEETDPREREKARRETLGILTSGLPRSRYNAWGEDGPGYVDFIWEMNERKEQVEKDNRINEDFLIESETKSNQSQNVAVGMPYRSLLFDVPAVPVKPKKLAELKEPVKPKKTGLLKGLGKLKKRS